MDKEELELIENPDDDLVHGENIFEKSEDQPHTIDYEEKREQLKSLKILKHTWSLSEIYQKVKAGIIKLDPNYQRKEVWNKDTQSQFIESLFIGIIIPPIYLAEIRPKKALDSITYEVVDGKQRLTSIQNFFDNKLNLTSDLQYYADLFGSKDFEYIEQSFPDEVEKMLSSVIDLYVISQNAHPEIKYDVFARLNRGSIKLTQAELRNAIYASNITDEVREEVKKIEEFGTFATAFSPAEKKRFKNINRVFQSLAYIEQFRNENGVVYFEKYNSRPKDMINTVLQKYQNNTAELKITNKDIPKVVKTVYLLKELLNKSDVIKKAEEEKGLSKSTEYTLDALMPFYKVISESNIDDIINKLYSCQDFLNTFEKSLSTTTNVNARVGVVNDVISKL
ncbi:GmrSD restriction endonuclease domain-containing protein [Sporosarcina sp. FSL K6-3457]|uniref:GmrSD restriction endonuclease domain-containing protein n=1 Tax=Sporosarcina sp. FSL K6-3457 TaxID=2978204 RepID=UPI0030F8E33C